MSMLKNNHIINLYYSNTDSIVIDKPLTGAIVGNRLGQFKLEYEINRAVFLARLRRSVWIYYNGWKGGN